MSSRNRNDTGMMVMSLLVLGTICAILVGFHTTLSRNVAATQPEHPAASALASARSPAPESHSQGISQLVRLSPDQVLATVNGSVIRLADILPLADTNDAQQITLDKTTLNYYLKRAVDRTLIFQKAQQQRITLDDSQHQQLVALQAMRNQPEPGGIARLNDSAAANQLEIQDSEAFMLQTTLMSAQGDSPNVTEDQVTSYYNQHESQFGGMSLDSIEQNQEMWQQVEVQIRNELASSVRAIYNNQVANYMGNLESQANITMAPLASL